MKIKTKANIYIGRIISIGCKSTGEYERQGQGKLLGRSTFPTLALVTARISGGLFVSSESKKDG